MGGGWKWNQGRVAATNARASCGSRSNLDFFPVDVEVRTLLVAERFHRVAKDHQHAQAMIDHWLDTQPAAPKVADLVSLASSVRSPSSPGLPEGCGICQGEPFVFVEERGGADRCTCPRGQALRQLERQHEQDEPAPWRRRGIRERGTSYA